MRPNPRGIRNFNPGNIRHAKGVRWQGQAASQADTDFVQFTDPRWGIRAIARVLITYQDKRRAADGSRIDTVREIIERWAPPNENNTEAYVISVAGVLQIGPNDETIDVYDYATMRTLVMAIVRHENGTGSLPGGQWYGDNVIKEGLALAGVVPDAVHGRGIAA
ncbi:hypothetical protein PSCICO_07940 [Pseudomonas cichorii]|uniref:structural protein n=1 Tax=Pseudomonas cichorii TaxID=36746 RepID=UPI0019107933|nr:structural protein [Pseudomonas cichorii]GFM85395.1 hypothetical protein PSCICO_07940 [Pseudomonas cichorii]